MGAVKHPINTQGSSAVVAGQVVAVTRGGMTRAADGEVLDGVCSALGAQHAVTLQLTLELLAQGSGAMLCYCRVLTGCPRVLANKP